jgi:hypothetical protein
VDGGAGGAAPVFDVWVGLVGVEVAFALCGSLVILGIEGEEKNIPASSTRRVTHSLQEKKPQLVHAF